MFERKMDIRHAEKILADLLGGNSVKVSLGEAGKGCNYDRTTAALQIDPNQKRASGSFEIAGALLEDICSGVNELCSRMGSDPGVRDMLAGSFEAVKTAARETWHLKNVPDQNKDVIRR